MSPSDRGWLTFDCYGTLVDWRTGMEDALATLDPDRVPDLLAGYHRHEPGLQEVTPILTYREVLTRGLVASALDAEVRLEKSQSTVLADTMPTWPAFEETPAVLTRLREDGWRLGILSNVDNDVITQTLELLEAPIDLVVTAQDVGSYKPGLAHFDSFRRAARPGAGRWVHVACSWYHDVVPASLCGVPSVFINREGEEHGPGVVLGVLPNLRNLPDTLDKHFPR